MTITQTGRRLALVGLLALVAAMLPLTGASAITGDNALQLAPGVDNVQKSINNSQIVYTPLTNADGTPATPDNPPTEALIGRADLFADNLAAGALQGTALANGRPLYLNDETEGVNAAVLAEMTRVVAAGGTIHILGGLLAQGAGVQAALEAAGFTTNRYAGETRTETAIAIATARAADTALLVRSTASADSADPTQAFADALGAGALAATNGYSILFTQTGTLTESTADYLASAGAPSNVIVVGGPLAVSQDVMDEVDGIVSGTVTRVAGDTRFGTAVELNGLRATPLGDVAIGTDGQVEDAWADGFTIANLSGLNNYPVVLSNGANVPAETETYLQSIRTPAANSFANHFTNIAMTCTSTAAPACAALLAAAGGTGTVMPFPPVGPPPTPTATTQPELRSAVIDGTVETINNSNATPAGTTVTYTFDEPVTTAIAGNFRVYTNANTQFTGTTVVGFTPGNSTVTVRFTAMALQSSANAATITLATVAQNAVLASDGQGNPEGDASIGSASTSQVSAGTTNSPDLLSVGGFRLGTPSTTTAVDFTFDEIAFVQNIGNFELIPADGSAAIPCTASTSTSTPSGGTVAGGSGTMVITAACTNPGGTTTAIPSGNIARGNTLAGAVGDSVAGGNVNVQQSAIVANNGVSTNPDLTQVTFEPNAAPGIDRVIYIFDQAVATTNASSPNTGFTIYTSLSMTASNGFVNTLTNVGNTGRVAVDYPDNTLSQAVGASVAAGTVTAAPGTTGGLNLRDELPVANAQATTITPGQTSGPQLTGVTLADSTDATGASTGFRATYVFDQDVDINASGSFFLWASDGTRLTTVGNCTNPSAEDTDNTVTCSFIRTGVTSANVQASVLGTVAFDAVRAEGATMTGPSSNPEGGELTTGGNGTLAS